MKHFTYIFIIIPFFSCNNPNVNNQDVSISEKNEVDTISKLKNSSKNSLVKELNFGDPCNLLIELADTLQKIGWKNDTSYFSPTPSSIRDTNQSISYFNNLPFYRIEYSDHLIQNWKDLGLPSASLINYEVLDKVNNIWFYYYRQDTIDQYIPDGIIEQWTFKNSTDAKNAYDNLILISPLPYFNTKPFHYLHGVHIIMFSTRAMMFSYYQYHHYELLKKIST